MPRSLQNQMLLVVALALLVAQGIGAGLSLRAQMEREENAIVHSLAFRLIGGRIMLERMGDDMRAPPGRPSRGGRLLRMDELPMQAGDRRETHLEQRLDAILDAQGVEADEIRVFERAIADIRDPRLARFAERRRLSDPRSAPRDVIMAAVQIDGADEWLVARTVREKREPRFVRNLILQTILIYVVLIGAIALILRRITNPLKQLTRRVQDFSVNPTLSPEGRVEPQGPLDTRELISAHNVMEARIGALLDEKDVMLGAIGHDLKTPLAALRVRIEGVDDDIERAKMAGTIEDITRTLDDILSLARVGRPSDPVEPTEIAALTASVVEEFEDMGQPVELGDTQRVVLPVRATWLRRAIRNLASNAVRYADGACVEVTRDKTHAFIRVIDNGPGIPEDELSRMMEPFQRGDPSRNRGTGGAGIGLALARAIAEQHGGKLTLRNRAEGGLCAEIRLPV